jgi:hypothetical protein
LLAEELCENTKKKAVLQVLRTRVKCTVLSSMISLREALQLHIRQPGRPNEYRINKITFCTADRNRGTGGKRISLIAARLTGKPSLEEMKGIRLNDPEKKYRRGQNWLNFYDEHVQQHFKVHLDLIEYVNDLEIS